jgi:cyclopropane fatty-acyl-phospholipid synthase-like methyltransferase
MNDADGATFDEAMRVREAMLQAALFDERDFADRASALEAGMARAPDSTRLRVAYRRTMSGWAATLQATGGSAEAQVSALIARAQRHDPGFLKAMAAP